MDSAATGLSLDLASEIQLLSDESAPRNPILEGVRFSLRFVATFDSALLVLVFLLTLYHHTFARRTPRRQAQTKSTTTTTTSYGLSPSSSAAASLASSRDESTSSCATMKHELEDEHTPLLSRASQDARLSFWRRTVRKTRAVVMYHPVSFKDLQGNDTSIFVLLLLAFNLFYTFYNITLTRPLIYVLADRTGTLFVVNLPWLYFLSAKNQPFRLLTGTSYEGLNILHRGLGKWLAVLAAMHAVGMVIVWYDFLLPRGLDVWWYLSRNIIWTGLAAFSCYMILTLTSTVTFRSWWYEMFLATHVIMQAGGLVFLYLHHKRNRRNILAALFIFLVDRLVYRYGVKTRTFHADLTVMEDGNTIMVSSNWTLQRRWPKLLGWIFSQNLRQGWYTSDHIFLTVPAMAKKHVIQAHPFTIASAAPEDNHSNAWLSLIIRARDGFTKDLLKFAQTHSSTVVRLDGPYGSPHAYEMLVQSDTALVVAGGSGIAVAYPLLWRLLRERSQQNSAVRACLLWIVHDAAHISWIGQDRLAELESMGLQVVLPPPTRMAGRPDVVALVDDVVHKLCEGKTDPSVSVIVSGPDAMNRSVRNACSSLAWKGLDIHVAVEVFDW